MHVRYLQAEAVVSHRTLLVVGVVLTLWELRPTHMGMEVTLWLGPRLRDHGGVIFIDVRDRTGLAQVVCNPGACPAGARQAGGLRYEYVIAAQGR